MSIPAALKYAATHEWIAAADTPAKVGITHHAQNELSDVVYVELPKVGRIVKAKEPVAVVESVKAASDIYAPVSGEITAVNDALSADPALINQQPYEGGWVFELRPSDPAELEALHDPTAYKKLIGG